MKIRNGFVSNSSSSSFLVYGFKLEETDALFESFMDNIDKYYNNDNTWDYIKDFTEWSDNVLIGYTLADTEGVEEVDLDLSDLDAKKQKVIEAFKNAGVDFSDRYFKLFLGEMYG